jgi:hypothetical protein
MVPLGSHSRTVVYTQIAAHILGSSAAWMRRRSGKPGIHAVTAGAIGETPGPASDLPEQLPALIALLRQEGTEDMDHEAVAEAILALREADAVIVGPLRADDANAPGLLPHVAALASSAYLALRPPRELAAHPGFGQIARRFHFIQLSQHDARVMGAGAADIVILARRLHQLQGDGGEFAITAFGGHGLLWADEHCWEIEPTGCAEEDEARLGAAFCTAWVVARWFLGDPPGKALADALSAVAATMRSAPERLVQR